MDFSTNEAAARIQEAEDKYAAALKRTERMRAVVIRQPIDGQLGTVSVNIKGDLLSVDLTPENLQSVPEQRLADLVKNAVEAAEQAAKQKKADMLAER